MEGPGKIKHSRPVPPFLRWCSATIPAVFDDSLTYYEALCSLWKWLQTNLVEVVNNNATVTQEYIQMVDELKEFVENYFENLDVQEEINNKLDQMAEDGTLQEIIGSYLESNVAWTFDNVTAMKESTNLIAGSYAQTIGYYEKNDGGAALYYIVESDETANEGDIIALTSGLKAKLVANKTINIKQFGAKGDGNTNDTNALLNAIAYGGNREFVINFNTNETYIIGGEIPIYSNKTLELNGATLKDVDSPVGLNNGKNDMQFLNNTASLASAGYGAIKNFNIRNGKFDGNVGGVMFCLLHAENCKFENIEFINAFHNTHVFDLGACKNIEIKNCKFYGNTLTVAGNKAREVIQPDYATYTAMPYWGENESIAYDGLPTINLVIEGCEFKKYAGDTYYLNGVGTHAISEGFHENIVIKNCVFHDCEHSSIRFPKVKNLVIENNTFLDESSDNTRTSQTAIYLSGMSDTEAQSSNITINENILKVNGGAGTLGFARITGYDNTHLINDVLISANNVEGIRDAAVTTIDWGDFTRINNVDYIEYSDNYAKNIKNFIYIQPISGQSQIVNVIKSCNNYLNHIHKYVRSSETYANSGSLNISQSGNTWEDDTGKINFNEFTAKAYLTADYTPDENGRKIIPFDTTDNPFITLASNGNVQIPDFILSFDYEIMVTVNTSDASVSPYRDMQVWARGGQQPAINGCQVYQQAAATTYNISTPRNHFDTAKFYNEQHLITAYPYLYTVDTLKYGGTNYKNCFVIIKGC